MQPNPQEQSTTTKAPERTEKNWPPDRKIICGIGALALWFVIFATGILIPSAEYRKILGWQESKENKQETAIVQAEDSAKDASSQQKIAAIENAVNSISTTIEQAKKENQKISDKSAIQIYHDLGIIRKELRDEIDPPSSKAVAFLIATVSFMPLNVGFLCVLAAFLGGCSVNKEEVFNLEAKLLTLPEGQERAQLARRLEYLKENPFYSAVRGLVVYLVLTSGLQIIGTSPVFEGLSDKELLSNYIKQAGLFSFCGYLAGYDPTVFTSMINFGSKRLSGDREVSGTSNSTPTPPTTT